MIRRAFLLSLLALPCAAQAADLPRHHHVRHHHARARVVHHVAQPNHVITCTTTNWVLFSSADCGQGFDPLSSAAY